MKEYFQVAIAQHIERASQLLARIDDSKVPQEYFVLSAKAREEIIRAKQELEDLRDNIDFSLPELQTIRLRRFRRAIDLISRIETTAVAALSRWHDDDIFLNRLVMRIRNEIDYPLLPPTVTSLSNNYFYIHNDIGLMFVPLNEGNYLLHLPDLYHELAHPLLFDKHSPKSKTFRRGVETALAEVLDYIEKQKEIEQRRQGPQEFLFYFYLWQRSWWSWMVEFFCDLFAVYTLGPAFAWSHIHLCMKSEQNPFDVPTHATSTHPADDARMQVMLISLKKLGFAEDAEKIEGRWEDYLKVSNAQINGNYKRCFPKVLLEQIVDLAHSGVSDAACRLATKDVADPIHTALNDAWVQFWNYPQTYIVWERDQVNKLHELLGLPQKLKAG